MYVYVYIYVFIYMGRPDTSGLRVNSTQPSPFGLYKIFVHFNAFVNEPIIILLPLPPVMPTLLQ